ncbi:MAG: hypothetical protein NVS4B12_25780 [Ktedonobacteraceae bacterium]
MFQKGVIHQTRTAIVSYKRGIMRSTYIYLYILKERTFYETHCDNGGRLV